ncbi:MAG: carboxypeptidase-like regulatory domain-containing protein [Planctomycetota bacterium]|nr:carboxypeptidase-like regulatory domain-containing protein [Planctomycetota bacterium]
MKLFLPLTLIVVMAAALGCGSDAPKGPEKISTTPVDGVVTLNGKPAAEVSISLHHSEGKVAPRGISDKDGKFSIATYGKDDGAPAGKYKVTAAKNMTKEISPGVLAPPPPGGFKSDIPTKYESVNTTDILVEIKAGEKNSLKIDLK